MADTGATLTRPTGFRVALYESIRRTAEQQREALHGDDFDRFHSLLMERERLLVKAEEVSRMARTGSSSESDEAERVHAALIVQEILDLDRQTGDLLSEKITETRQEAAKIQDGHAAVRGYGHLRVVGESHFVDQAR